ncbi:MAG: tyrosine-type recombinase/integrase [Dysgonamonadaceae bacterium]|jgi:integrase|nr:tyrosine-type recombinase/integrase [Dysgonamonadaceae bacterium]
MGRIRKSKPTANFVLRTDRKADNNNKYHVNIQYYHNRLPAKGQTDVWVNEKDWDADNQRVKKSEPQYIRYNLMLDKKKNEVDALILDFKGKLTIEILRSMTQGTYNSEPKIDEVDFIQYTFNYLQTQYKLENISYSTFANQTHSMEMFKGFVKKTLSSDILLMKELNEGVMDNYIIWRKERGNSNESINKTLTPIIKSSKNAAANELLKPSIPALLESKYLNIKPKLSQEDVVDEEDKDVNYLTEEQMIDFLRVYKEVKHDSTRAIMDIFLFSFHACGLRFSDLLTLKWENINWKNKELTKILFKGNKKHTIYLCDAAMKILEVWKDKNLNKKFVFNLLPPYFDLKDEAELFKMRKNKNRTLVTSLNSVGVKMGLPFKLTIHNARHTFAVLALNEKKISMHIIKELLAHSSVIVTEKVYAKFLPKTIDLEVREKLTFNYLPEQFEYANAEL